MKVRLWIPDDCEIKLVEIVSIKQVDSDVCVTTNNGDRFYVKGDNYARVFEDAEKLNYIKNVVKTLY